LVCPSYILLSLPRLLRRSLGISALSGPDRIEFETFLFLKPSTTQNGSRAWVQRTKNHAALTAGHEVFRKHARAAQCNTFRRRRAIENDLSPANRHTVCAATCIKQRRVYASPSLTYTSFLLTHLLASCRRMRASLLAA
jgi:hypothetical protein